MRGRILAVCAALSLAAAAPAHAGIEKAGTTAANFLSVGTGPGALAMGGAAIGRSGSLDLVGWNAGSLGFMREGSVLLSHANLDDQTTQEWAAIGGRFGMLPTRWAITGLYQNEGKFEGRDASNNPTSAFTAGSAALGFQLAQRITPNISLGLGSKWILDRLGDVSGTGYTFDAGLAMRYGAWGAGFSAQNAFGNMTYEGLKYPFPTSYGGGISYSHATSGVTAALDLNVPDADYTNVRGGLEWMWNQNVALRAGYRADLGATGGGGLGGPTFGMGAGIHSMWLDYGFLLQGTGGGQHRLALSFRPGMLSGQDTDYDAQSDGVPVGAALRPTVADAPKAKPAVDVPQARPSTPESSTPPQAAPAVSSNVPKSSDAPPARTPDVATPPASRTPAPPASNKPEARTSVGSRVIAGAKGVAGGSPAAPAAPPRAVPAAPPIVTAPAKTDTARTASAQPKVDTVASAKPALSQSEMDYQPPTAKAENDVRAKGKHKTKSSGGDDVQMSEKRPEKVTVKRGETMQVIAQRWGVAVPSIMMENNLVREDVKPGQVLRLPALPRRR